MNKLKELFLQAVRFGLVGVLNTAVDMLVFFLLTRFPIFALHVGWAHTISYSCGMLNSLGLNRIWTFRDRSAMSPRRIMLFVLVNLASYGVSLAVLTVLTGRGLNEMLAKAVATVFALGVNFVGNKLFVFKS